MRKLKNPISSSQIPDPAHTMGLAGPSVSIEHDPDLPKQNETTVSYEHTPIQHSFLLASLTHRPDTLWPNCQGLVVEKYLAISGLEAGGKTHLMEDLPQM